MTGHKSYLAEFAEIRERVTKVVDNTTDQKKLKKIANSTLVQLLGMEKKDDSASGGITICTEIDHYLNLFYGLDAITNEVYINPEILLQKYKIN